MSMLTCLIMFLLLHLCDNSVCDNPPHTDPRSEWLKTLPDVTSDYYSRCQGLCLDQTFYHFIYRDSIDGYSVTGFIVDLELLNNEAMGNAILEFKRNDKRSVILHSSFTIDKEQLDKINNAYGEEDGDTFFSRSGSLGFYLDYKIAKDDTTIHRWSVPFFFEDMNSDGKKDLILRHPNQGYKIGDRYSVHYLQWSGYFKQEPDAHYDSYTP